jgi:MFS family permease
MLHLIKFKDLVWFTRSTSASPVSVRAQNFRTSRKQLTILSTRDKWKVAGPLVMAAPPLLSAQWFPDRERTTATAIASLANNFGSAGGFLLGPLLVKEAADLPKLLYAHAALAGANLLLILAYFPTKPSEPPSAAAEVSDSPSLPQSGHPPFALGYLRIGWLAGESARKTAGLALRCDFLPSTGFPEGLFSCQSPLSRPL